VSEFERPLPSYRLVETRRGDDLQAVASRELGDANRWPELVWLNALTWPFLTDDERRVGPGVQLTGSLVKVPAPTGFIEAKSSSEDVYGRDCLLRGRQLEASEDGDFAIVAGVDNLTQQLTHAINTPRGQARRHPNYGCMIWRLVGTVNGPVAGMMGAEYVKATLMSDYRVTGVPVAQAEIVGDAVRITAKAEAVAGGSVDLQAERSAS